MDISFISAVCNIIIDLFAAFGGFTLGCMTYEHIRLRHLMEE